MNTLFKNEFKNLNPEEIKLIVNRCSGMDILEHDATKSLNHLKQGKYFLKYIDNDEYGYWAIGYGWKNADAAPISIGGGFFEYQIKITPFRISFEDMRGTTINPYLNPHHQKQLEEYLFIHFNQKCPNYKNAIREQTEQFIKFIDGFSSSNKSNEHTK